MRNEGLGSWPARRARKTPHRTALLHHTTLRNRTGPRHHDDAAGHADAAVSYAGLHERTTRLAHALRAHGVRRGDRVAYLGPNHPSFLEALFAAGLLGAVFVPLNTRLAAPEIAYQLADSGARLLLHAPSHTALATDATGAGGDDAQGTPARVAVGGSAYEELLAAMVTEPVDEPVALDDTAIIMYTSGTTGRPKGAVLTHGNLTWNAVNVLIDHDLTAGEVALASAPLFHIAGLNMLALPVLLKGGTCLVVEGFDPGDTLELIERHRVTFMFGVPAMFDRIAHHRRWAGADLSSLRILTCGGSPVPTRLIATYQSRGLTFLQGYGMTEAAPGVLFLDAEHATAKAGSAGVPHFFSDVRVVRPDLTPVDVGEAGEILVRGPHVMPGYWGLPEESAAAFADGWFRSGDAARVDTDGYVTVVDRIKDMIISGGENIYPAEVEDALLAHPDIVECAVIGVPDEKWGEVGRAVVVAREGAELDPDEVLGSLSGRLAKYKIPKSAVTAAELPRTASGKLLKARVRSLYGTP
ncbi:AMP-dependent synthetase [Streptomyces sp. CNQ-509]|uniref:o-succinylbenzoate--CoA ligase n=1 Tax=Streptomyces sp. CNQ-509 TaxID=444103 RepID=UPI00062DCAC6|nr:o-succinylbenzoate--CoA ligase [Streptomyces sp. CNQ-509]AKH85641.1 AMP-dependent synthetase [Streptomyces sp. CNQ-509]